MSVDEANEDGKKSPGTESAAESLDSITNEHNNGVDQKVFDDLADEQQNDEEDEGLKAQEDVDRQRMEKCYRRQEEAWLAKREKVRKTLFANGRYRLMNNYDKQNP